MSDTLMKLVVTRGTDILPEVGSEGPEYLTAAEFENLLLDKPAGSPLEIVEDAVFRCLFAGFASSEHAWEAHLRSLLEDQQDWDTLCERAQSKTQITNQKLRLLAMYTTEVHHGLSFVHYVLRMVEVLKLKITWENCTKKWKTAYLKAAFKTDYHSLCHQYDSTAVGSQAKADAKTAMDKEFKHYKKQYGCAMQQLGLLVLYQQFGPGILPDMMWDTIIISDHVTAFLREHPPENSDPDWTWEEYEQGQNEEGEE
ncbi:hypothetical protein K438DRAFT_1997018 [Mycena galopus ATCC 62051]|nr:hypothetical protein K438DRAFT_1997018 [Mycena galopus ATCC 62051]